MQLKQKLAIIITGLVIVSCGVTTKPVNILSKETNSISKTSVNSREDLLAKTIINKQESRLQKMLKTILNGGVLVSTKVTARRFADGTEISTEKWIVENNKKDRFLAIWENGVLISINDIEKIEQEKPLGE